MNNLLASFSTKVDTSPKTKFYGEVTAGGDPNSWRGQSSYSIDKKISSSSNDLPTSLKSPSKWYNTYNPFHRRSTIGTGRPQSVDNSNKSSLSSVFKKPRSVALPKSQPNSPGGGNLDNFVFSSNWSNPTIKVTGESSNSNVNKIAKTPTTPVNGSPRVRLFTPNPSPAKVSSKGVSPGLKFSLSLAKSFKKSKLPTATASKTQSPSPIVEDFKKKYLVASDTDSESKLNFLFSKSGSLTSSSASALSSNGPGNSNVNDWTSSIAEEVFVPATSFMKNLDKDDQIKTQFSTSPSLLQVDSTVAIPGRHTIGPGTIPKFTPKKPPRPSLTRGGGTSAGAGRLSDFGTGRSSSKCHKITPPPCNRKSSILFSL